MQWLHFVYVHTLKILAKPCIVQDQLCRPHISLTIVPDEYTAELRVKVQKLSEIIEFLHRQRLHVSAHQKLAASV
jgi:hypothetical protein